MTLFLRRQAFDNRRFWNRRYVEEPEKGSGPGSRGENAALKRELTRATTAEYGIRTIRDIDCGDIECPHADVRKVAEYRGTDLLRVEK
jgi:hypothetical protein